MEGVVGRNARDDEASCRRNWSEQHIVTPRRGPKNLNLNVCWRIWVYAGDGINFKSML